MEIKYVKMPITKEEKQKYNREGFRVIDERFKPADYEEPETDQEDGDLDGETAAERKARRAAERKAKKEADQQKKDAEQQNTEE